MDTSWIAPFHRHFGELMILMPLAVIIVAAIKGKSPLPRITAVLLDIQLVFGLVTFALVSKTVSIPHVVCMVAALGLAHAFAKRDNPKTVARAFTGVLALIVAGYLFQKNHVMQFSL